MINVTAFDSRDASWRRGAFTVFPRVPCSWQESSTKKQSTLGSSIPDHVSKNRSCKAASRTPAVCVVCVIEKLLNFSKDCAKLHSSINTPSKVFTSSLPGSSDCFSYSRK